MFITLLIIVLLVFILRRTSFSGRRDIFVGKGAYGEIHVSHILASLPDGYRVFNDVYLNIDGYSVQIDHVVISVYGVFVIETKNYTGDIYGCEDSEYWTQNIHGNRYELRNPIKQNIAHVLSIEKTLGIAHHSIIPIVVFLNKVNLRCNTLSPVLYSSQLLDYILGKQRVMFTQDGVGRLAAKLTASMNTGHNRKEDHIQSVRKRVAEQKQKISNMICPRCGGQLVVRQGKYGRFLCCSNYPHCKFTSHV